MPQIAWFLGVLALVAAALLIADEIAYRRWAEAHLDPAKDAAEVASSVVPDATSRE